MVNIFTDDNFNQEVLQSTTPVLVDFWAPWCGPCKMQGPIVEELANGLQDKAVKVGKLNVDENQNTSSQFHVMSIPTLIIFKDGKIFDQMIGVHDKAALAKKLEAAMG